MAQNVGTQAGSGWQNEGAPQVRPRQRMDMAQREDAKVREHAMTKKANPTVAALQRLLRKIRSEARERENTTRRMDPLDGRSAAWARHDAAATWMRLAETWVVDELRKAKR